MHRPWHAVGILVLTQIASWGSLYYAFGILAAGIGHDLALRQELVYNACSWSLLAAGLVATPTGMLLDRFGGQWAMITGAALCGVAMILDKYGSASVTMVATSAPYAGARGFTPNPALPAANRDQFRCRGSG